jgi:dihydropteroate synthase
LNPKQTLNINGRLVDLSTPKVMGILNVTPDSFFAQSRKSGEKEIIQTAEKMLAEGATFLDVGGYSSRPGAEDISVEDEINRVAAPIKQLSERFPEAVISIDTFRSDVARAALDAGAHVINDISGGILDADMIPLAGRRKVPYIAMHMRGTPQTMKNLTLYDDVLLEVMQYFSDIIAKAKAAGIHDLILDPGFGFAKTLEQNYYLLQHLDHFKRLDCPILVGVSRKSMIYKLLDCSPDEALNGTTALNSVALLKGANILRVHDVNEATEAIRLITQLHDSRI